jgi:hypothetical protein
MQTLSRRAPRSLRPGLPDSPRAATPWRSQRHDHGGHDVADPRRSNAGSNVRSDGIGVGRMSRAVDPHRATGGDDRLGGRLVLAWAPAPSASGTCETNGRHRAVPCGPWRATPRGDVEDPGLPACLHPCLPRLSTARHRGPRDPDQLGLPPEHQGAGDRTHGPRFRHAAQEGRPGGGPSAPKRHRSLRHRIDRPLLPAGARHPTIRCGQRRTTQTTSARSTCPSTS